MTVQLMINRLAMLVLLVGFLQSSPVIGNDFPLLNGATDQALQDALSVSLEKLHLDQAIAEKRLAVSVVDITDPAAPRMAEVNGNVMLYAASLPKIGILLGAMQRIHEGTLALDSSLQSKLERMIRHSSNTAASEVLTIVVEQYLADLLQSDKYQLYKPERGGLWVGKTYGKAPAWKRHPLYNISHGASANEVARFYYLLATNRLVSEESCDVMRDILKDPAISHKFVAGIQRIHPDATIYRKSGTWRTYHSDSAIIDHDGRQYIVVALANDANGGQWLENIIVEMDQIVFATANETRISQAAN